MEWELRPVPLKFYFSYWSPLTVKFNLQCRSVSLMEDCATAGLPIPPCSELVDGSQGFMIRALPVAQKLPRFTRQGHSLCYVLLQYRHFYIDLRLSFADYLATFSSKTRATLQRKVRKYAEHCGGEIPWKEYRRREELSEFFRLARTLSRLTYQERMLDAGLPDHPDFLRSVEQLAAEDRVRAYILFDRDRPVSYLFCPVKDDVLLYSYLGYDPAYVKMSVGSVLQWLALERLFGERRFRAFDFTEGESEHKRLFSTNERLCANVLIVRDSLPNRLIVRSHLHANEVSEWLGRVLESLGLKASIKRLLRFPGWRRKARRGSDSG